MKRDTDKTSISALYDSATAPVDMMPDLPSYQDTATGASSGRPFKGYTLEELRIRRIINELKIRAVKDRLRLTYSFGAKGEAGTVKHYMNSFDNMMRYVDIAMLAYGVTRRVARLFRRFSRDK